MSTAKGNAGEHLAMAILLSEGFDAYMADRGNPAFDIAVWSGAKASRLRVKTTHNSSAIWTAKKDGTLFLDMQTTDDFVFLVDLAKSWRQPEFYLVPTVIVDECLRSDHAKYCSIIGPSGKIRNGTTTDRHIRLFGPEKMHNPTFGYDAKWAHYRNNLEPLRT